MLSQLTHSAKAAASSLPSHHTHACSDLKQPTGVPLTEELELGKASGNSPSISWKKGGCRCGW
jgi:hypothetical protein